MTKPLATLKDIWNTEETHNKTYSAIEVHAMKREFIADLKQMAIEWVKEIRKNQILAENWHSNYENYTDSPPCPICNEGYYECNCYDANRGRGEILFKLFNLTESDLKET